MRDALGQDRSDRKVIRVSSAENDSDMQTKALDRVAHYKNMRRVGLMTRKEYSDGKHREMISEL